MGAYLPWSQSMAQASIPRYSSSGWIALAGESVREEAEVGGATLALQVGAMAQLADGSCVASMGDTLVLATAVGRTQPAWSRRERDTLQVCNVCACVVVLVVVVEGCDGLGSVHLEVLDSLYIWCTCVVEPLVT